MSEQIIYCTICNSITTREDARYLPLYAIGSEGIVVCLLCRIALTECAKNMKSAAGRSRRNVVIDRTKRQKAGQQ